VPIYFAAVTILVSLVLSAWALRSRSDLLDEILYKQCVSNENQDAVIVSILNSIPPQRRSQVVNDAIAALEPPDEKPCQPPKGVFP
jgi:hypothetical protein